MLTAETLDGEEQYNNASASTAFVLLCDLEFVADSCTDVATNLFAKLERLLEAARGKDNGPQPLYVCALHEFWSVCF